MFGSRIFGSKILRSDFFGRIFFENRDFFLTQKFIVPGQLGSPIRLARHGRAQAVVIPFQFRWDGTRPVKRGGQCEGNRSMENLVLERFWKFPNFSIFKNFEFLDFEKFRKYYKRLAKCF